MQPETLKTLLQPSGAVIVMLVIDGLGGLPDSWSGLTELEAAKTPNFDALCKSNVCGLHEPAGPGITPGSGLAHLALFGYDPLHFHVGRGVLSALGIGIELGSEDLAVRGNFCTVDEQGNVTDRRAGRISTEENRALCCALNAIKLSGAELIVEPVKDHRFVMVLRAKGLCDAVADTDPQKTGVQPLRPEAQTPEGALTAGLVQEFIAEVQKCLRAKHPANMVLLRGFSKKPSWPTMMEKFGLHAAAIADYPMYRGVARLLGMDVLDTGDSPAEKLRVLKSRRHDYDFFFVHIKQTDSAGEDGDYAAKVACIEEIDACVPQLLECVPDVLVVTGDHSTPAAMQSHSWHPVPVLLVSNVCRSDHVMRFGERACLQGGLGCRMPAHTLMPVMLAHAGKLAKYGA